jgi:F0F1-type ATP synthase membrane subunit b/b'
MIHDPSFWVAVSFIIFCVIAFRPLLQKSKAFLQDYRLQITSEIAELKTYVQEASLSLGRAEELSKKTEKDIEEIRQNTEVQIAHIKKDLEQELVLLSDNQKKQLNFHKDFLKDQAEKELRQFLLTQAIQEVQDIFSQAPQGMPSFFKQSLQKAVQMNQEGN